MMIDTIVLYIVILVLFNLTLIMQQKCMKAKTSASIIHSIQMEFGMLLIRVGVMNLLPCPL